MPRRGGMPTTEQRLTLDFAQCMALKQFRPRELASGDLCWVNSRSRQVTARMAYLADMRDPEAGQVHLSYDARDMDGVTTRHDHVIRLTTTQPHFGGHRWWFNCPKSGRRVRCLYFDRGGFASRRAIGLGYQCQRETWANKRLRAAQMIDSKLGGNGNLSLTPRKPKWMRWPTFYRLTEALERASHQSVIGALMAIDDSGTRELVDREIEADPQLLAGSRREKARHRSEQRLSAVGEAGA